MFRFNRSVFIISNYCLSFFCFIIIYMFRYSWISFTKVEKRILDLTTVVFLLLYSLTIIILNISLKTYEINKISRITESIILNIFISILSIGIFGIYFYFTQTNFARFVFFLGFFIIPFILSIFNKILFIIISKKKKPIKILYFGSNSNHMLFTDLINKYSKWFPMKVTKVLNNEGIDKIKKNINIHDILAVDTDQKYKNNYVRILNNYEIQGGKIYSLIDFFDYFDQSMPAEIIANNHYEFFSSYKLDSFYNIYIKRIFDILFSLLFIIFLSPVILITIILIKITSPGKILFKQIRLTIKGEKFLIYKFRSMKEENIRNKKYKFTEENDSRVTFIGRIIRSLRIDEIPQLFNILTGKMSLIGPRPELPEIFEDISKKYPLFKKRLLVKPGLTGWAQVKYNYVNKIEKMNEKLSYDLYYLNNLSFAFDLKILLYTIETVLFKRGAI